MRSRLDPGDFSAGLDLLLLGSMALVLGNYIISLSSVPFDSFTGHSGVTLLQAAGALPRVVGIVVTGIGLIAMIGGPLFFWLIWPLKHAHVGLQDHS